MSESTFICRYCGGWETKPKEHRFCGGCGAYVSADSLTVEISPSKDALLLNFSSSKEAGEHYEFLEEGGGYLSVSTTLRNFQSLPLIFSEQGQLSAELPVGLRNSRLYWTVGPDKPVPGFLPRPAGVVMRADQVGAVVTWAGPTQPLRALEGVQDVPIYLTPSAAICASSVAIIYPSGDNARATSIELQPLYGAEKNKLCVIGPNSPLKIRIQSGDIQAKLGPAGAFRFEIYDENQAVIGSGALRASLSGDGVIEFKIRSDIRAWGNEKTPARIPYSIKNTGGTPVEICDFKIVATQGALEAFDPLSAAFTLPAWQREPSTVPVGFQEEGEFRPVPSQAAGAEATIDNHEYTVSFKWRAKTEPTPNWKDVSANIQVTIRREERSRFSRRELPRFCVDFGTTQSSAVFIYGDLNNPTIRPIHLVRAGFEEGSSGSLFLDSAIAIGPNDQFLFGQHAILTKNNPDFMVVENLKWKLTSEERLHFKGKYYSHRDLAEKYLIHVRELINGHPDIGEKVDSVIVTCPAQFGAKEESVLLDVFTKAGLKPLELNFLDGECHLSESWPPVAWTLSPQGEQAEPILTGGGSHFRLLKDPNPPFIVPTDVLPLGQLTKEQEDGDGVAWLLTFDMGGGSTDLSLLRISGRRDGNAPPADVYDKQQKPEIEISDEARATSASAPQIKGFVGREFEQLTKEIVALKLGHLLDHIQPATTLEKDRAAELINCLNDRTKAIKWAKEDEHHAGPIVAAGIRQNSSIVQELSEAVRLDRGTALQHPLGNHIVPSMTTMYFDALSQTGLTAQSRQVTFVQGFLDTVEKQSSFINSVKRLPNSITIFNAGLLVPSTLSLSEIWWTETIALLASMMFDFDDQVDSVLKQALLPAARKASTTFVLSGRAGMFGPARAFAYAKFRHACDIRKDPDFKFNAIDGEEAKLVTSLGGAFMGRIFYEGNAQRVQFRVNRERKLGILSGMFIELQEVLGGGPPEMSRAAIKGPFRPTSLRLHTRNRAGYNDRQSALIEFGATERTNPNYWVVIERLGFFDVAMATSIIAGSASEAVEAVLAGGGVVLDVDNLEPE
jgi:hypothetical protein